MLGILDVDINYLSFNAYTLHFYDHHRMQFRPNVPHFRYFCFGSAAAAWARIACSFASEKSPRVGNRNFFKSANCCLSFSVGGYFASKWSAQNNPPKQKTKNNDELNSRVRRGIAGYFEYGGSTWEYLQYGQRLLSRYLSIYWQVLLAAMVLSWFGMAWWGVVETVSRADSCVPWQGIIFGSRSTGG